MKDLTEGPIGAHLVAIAIPLAAAMLAHLALQVVDLYFVTNLGSEAVVGVSAAGNIVLVTIAVNQILGIGTVVLIAHAVGRSDIKDAARVVNQCISLGIVCGATALLLLAICARPYLHMTTAHANAVEAGMTYLKWVLPGYALTFPMTALTSAMRGAGVVARPVLFSIGIVLMNIVLAPLLISHNLLGMGVAGAGLATSLSVLAGFIGLLLYCHRAHPWMDLRLSAMTPRLATWKRLLAMGLPAGCDFGLNFIFTAAVFYYVRDFGVAVQAGFAIGVQALQVLAFPGMALSYAAGPIAGQNFGASKIKRVKETFWKAACLSISAMIVATGVAQQWPSTILSVFDANEETHKAAVVFLAVSSWALVAQAVISACSSMFQGVGNTVPSVISSGTRLSTFIVPVTLLYMQPEFDIVHLWYLWGVSLALQAATSLLLLKVEFKRHCGPRRPTGEVTVAATSTESRSAR